MKNTIHKSMFFVLVLVYLLSGTGLSIISHYCEGELQEISFFGKPDPCCEGETSEQADDCCKNEETFLCFKADLFLKETNFPIKKAESVLSYFSTENFQFNSHPPQFISIVKANKFLLHPIIQSLLVELSVLRI